MGVLQGAEVHLALLRRGNHTAMIQRVKRRGARSCQIRGVSAGTVGRDRAGRFAPLLRHLDPQGSVGVATHTAANAVVALYCTG